MSTTLKEINIRNLLLRRLSLLSGFLDNSDWMVFLVFIVLGDLARVNNSLSTWRSVYKLRVDSLTCILRGICWNVWSLTGILHHFIEAVINIWALTSFYIFYLFPTERLAMTRGRLALARVSPSMCTACHCVLSIEVSSSRCLL